MHSSEGFLLGLSTGAVCLATCGPVLIPYLLAESNAVVKNFLEVGLFLSGRLVAYVLTGVITGIAGTLFLQNHVFQGFIPGIIDVILSLSLLAYAFFRFRHVCPGETSNQLAGRLGLHWPEAIPLLGGFASGLNFCPPFILAIAQASASGNIAGSVIYFVAFFAGTSLYFIPLPFIGFFHRKQSLAIIGKFAAIIAGLYFLYKGIFIIFH